MAHIVKAQATHIGVPLTPWFVCIITFRQEGERTRRKWFLMDRREGRCLHCAVVEAVADAFRERRLARLRGE